MKEKKNLLIGFRDAMKKEHLKLIEIVEISKKIGRYEFEISQDISVGLNPWGLEIETNRLKEKLNETTCPWTS